MAWFTYTGTEGKLGFKQNKLRLSAGRLDRRSTWWLQNYLVLQGPEQMPALDVSSKVNVVGGWPGLGKNTRRRAAGGVAGPWQEEATGSRWRGGRRDGEQQDGVAGVMGRSARW
jgi:hypothetical protein